MFLDGGDTEQLLAIEAYPTEIQHSKALLGIDEIKFLIKGSLLLERARSNMSTFCPGSETSRLPGDFQVL